MKTKNEDIIRKLFESKCSLSPEERAALNNYEYVNDTFHRQWEEMSEEAVDLVSGIHYIYNFFTTIFHQQQS